MFYATIADVSFEKLTADSRACKSFLAEIQANAGQNLNAFSESEPHNCYSQTPTSWLALRCMRLLAAFSCKDLQIYTPLKLTTIRCPNPILPNAQSLMHIR